ncbi:MAG: hypothetical protein MZW92_51160 [Comamonadaceae bacterium]|nr:hypothetical protein [Comamonadaceae bacterium]
MKIPLPDLMRTLRVRQLEQRPAPVARARRAAGRGRGARSDPRVYALLTARRCAAAAQARRATTA